MSGSGSLISGLHRTTTHSRSAGMLGALGQEVIHIIADAVTKHVTDFPDVVESGDQAVPAVVGERMGRLESLLEHAHQRIEKSLLLIADTPTVSSRLLTVGNPYLRKSGRITHRLL